MNYRKSDRLPSYRFYRALQRQKSPMRYICEIFRSLAIFEFFNTIRQKRSFSSSQLLSPDRTWALCLGTQAERSPVTAVVVFEIRLSAR
jgi:hypothetical protein